MFIYKDLVELQYKKDQRDVSGEYRSSINNPMRDVARMELRGGK